MKIGMSLLICDSSLNLLTTHILYHSANVDKIVCIANRPSKLIVYLLKQMEKTLHNFELLEISNEIMTIEIQQKLCSKMSIYLKDKGCSWVIPCDDDEFYVGDLRSEIQNADDNNFNILYQDGYCFYTTWESDKLDINPIRNMRYRDSDTVDYAFRKAIHKTSEFVSTLPGNHWVTLSSPIRSHKTENLKIFHYHYRYKKIFADNEINGCYSVLDRQCILDKNLIFDDTLIRILNEKGIP